MNIKPLSFLFVVCALFTISCSKSDSDSTASTAEESPQSEQPKEEKKSNEVICTVNGEDITREQLDQQITTLMGSQAAQVPAERLDQVKTMMEPRAKDVLITRTLLQQAIAEEKITISEEKFNEAFNKLKSSVPAHLPFEEALKKMNLTEEDLKKQLTEDLEVRELFKNNVEEIKEPTSQEIKTFYETNKAQFNQPEEVEARHILIPFQSSDTPEKKAEQKTKAEGIRKQLIKAKGKNFADLAKEHSSCNSSQNGGSLGRFGKGRMVPPFEQAAFTQKEKQIGKVVETRFGYHIIQVQKKYKAGTIPFDKVKGKIQNRLATQKQQKAYQAYIDKLKAKAKIIETPVS